MKAACCSSAIALVAILAVSCSSSAATMSALVGPGDFLSPVTYTHDFEAGEPDSVPADTPQVAFAGTPKLGLAQKWTGGNTPSGRMGLVESVEDDPIRVEFNMPIYEVGMFFGNDDFGRLFNATLELFDNGGASLGAVQVRSNGNDFADQFIGARSPIAIKSAALSYQRPNAHLLSVYIDDLIVGGVIPEPSGAFLALFALLILSPGRCRNPCAM